MHLLVYEKVLQNLNSPMAIIVVLIGAIISGFFLQWAARMMAIFEANYSKCFFVSLIGIIADYGIAYLVYIEGYIGGFIGFLISLFINMAIIVGFFKISWTRALLLYILMRILSFIIGCLCCCGITRRFPSF